MFCETALRRIENDVPFVNAARTPADWTCSQPLQSAPEGLLVVDSQLDLDFLRHLYRCSPHAAVRLGFSTPRTSVSIADERISPLLSVTPVESGATAGARPPS